MTDQKIQEYIKLICEEFAKEGIDVLVVLKDDSNDRVGGTLCPVCALEVLQDYIEEEEITHNRNEIKVH